jgi:hypothetical protein
MAPRRLHAADASCWTSQSYAGLESVPRSYACGSTRHCSPRLLLAPYSYRLVGVAVHVSIGIAIHMSIGVAVDVVIEDAAEVTVEVAVQCAVGRRLLRLFRSAVDSHGRESAVARVWRLCADGCRANSYVMGQQWQELHRTSTYATGSWWWVQ